MPRCFLGHLRGCIYVTIYTLVSDIFRNNTNYNSNKCYQLLHFCSPKAHYCVLTLNYLMQFLTQLLEGDMLIFNRLGVSFAKPRRFRSPANINVCSGLCHYNEIPKDGCFRREKEEFAQLTIMAVEGLVLESVPFLFNGITLACGRWGDQVLGWESKTLHMPHSLVATSW